MDNKEVIAPVVAQAAADAYLKPASVHPSNEYHQGNETYGGNDYQQN